jgi:WD40 repeat protein
MSVLKTSCSECDAKLKLTVDGPGEHEVDCPKCGHTFSATLEDEGAPKKAEKPAAKQADAGTKAPKRRDDDTDEKPKKKKKKAAPTDSGNKKLYIAGGIGAALVAVIVVVVVATSGGKKPQVADNTNTQNPPVRPETPGRPEPPVRPGPVVPPKETPGTPPKKENPPQENNPPPKKDTDAELSTQLPPPPKLQVAGSLAPVGKPIVKPPVAPPLAPDEDPFNRASGFKLEGALPPLPKLPPAKERPLLSLEAGGHTAFVSNVFFTPKGDRVITVGQDKSVRIWDPVTNETVRTIRFPAGPGREGSLQAAALSRSGKKLAVAGEPLKDTPKGKVPVYIVNPDDGRLLLQINSATAAVRCMHFSADGTRLVIGNEDGSLQVFNATSGAQVGAPFAPSDAAALEIKFNPQPKWNVIATLAADRYVLLVNLSNPKQRVEFPVGKGVVPTSLAWSNDGQYLAIGSTGGSVGLFTPTGQLVKALPPILKNGRPVRITQVQFLPNDTELLVVGSAPGVGGFAGLIDSSTGKVRVECAAHTNVVFACDVSPDGNSIVTSGGNAHESVVWDADTAAVKHRLAGNGEGVWAVAWAKDGKSIAWGNSNKREGDSEELPLQNSFRLDEFGLGGTPDPGKYVQTVKADEGVKLLVKGNVFLVESAGRAPEAVRIAGDQIYSATLVPKGNAIIAGGAENLYLLNPTTLTRGARTYIGHTGNVLCVTPSPDGRYFATGSSDQTIRIWERGNEEPVLSIFVAGRDWIAWTPQGYYACSGQGERLIAWQITTATGAQKGTVAHPAERFRPSMYQPALLKYLIPAGDMARALAMAQKFDKALVATHSVADVLPPEVTLEGYGETEVRVESEKVVVKGKASSPKHPIVAMRLLVDGRPFMGSAGVKKFDGTQKEAEASWEVSLAPGNHTFAIIADTPVSKGISKIGLAFRPGEVPKPDLYVLAMGVSDYASIGKLRYCASDATLIEKTFKEKTGGLFGKVETKLLTDKQVTKAGMSAGLDWLKSKMTPKDIAIVSFSGHGARDPFGTFYLCTQDMKSADIDNTAMPGKEFQKRLEDLPGRIVAILDACHAGTAAEGSLPPTAADSLVRDLTAEDSGVIVLCASLGREYAIESNLTKAGFFTLGLVEGLSGHGDIDGDGLIYLHELNMYATARVRQLSGGEQNPTLGRPAGIRPFPLAKVPPRKKEEPKKDESKKEDPKTP